MKKSPLRDPEGAARRAATAKRRAGVNSRCECGEQRPLALIPGSSPTICAKCQREREGRSIMDSHHPFGKANDPETTTPTPVNDHRAELSKAQEDWPKRTRENPDGSPLLRAAACVRGFVEWYSLPDVAASVLLTGRIPKIVDAFFLQPNGKLNTLKPTKLRGTIDVDPSRQDFFRAVIEERRRLSKRMDISETDRSRLDKALKVLANAASYGIYAEMHRLESESKIKVKCFGIDADSFECRVAHPDEPGEYCFPPLASLITGGARLMLSLLETCVTELGGTYAMEDTDSMAVVATEKGGLIPCAGGPLRNDDGVEAIKALSWQQVDDIAERFKSLNPYSGVAGEGSVLKIEDDNRDPLTLQRRQIFCLAISAKRYTLFLKNNQGKPVLLRGTCPFCGHRNEPANKFCKNPNCGRRIHLNNREDRWSEHGLGHLLNPTDPESENRDWIADAWLSIVKRSLGFPASAPRFASTPAVGRITISSPRVLQPMQKLNEGKSYSDQIKPFNFLLTCHVDRFGHPSGVDPERFHLISPYQPDSRRWLKTKWIDQYSGKQYWITTGGHHGNRHTARVKTYGEFLEEYEYHAETKCADAGGNICRRQTVGLLQRGHVEIEQIKYIGKESNSLEEVETGMVHSEQSVYTEYPDPRRDEWQTKVLPALKEIPLSDLAMATAMSPSALKEIRAGRSRPHRKNQQRLKEILDNRRTR